MSETWPAEITPIDRDAARAAVASSAPFPNLMIDGFLDEAFAREVAASFPSHDEAAAVGKGFKSVNEKHKVQVTDATTFAEPIRRLNDALASPALLDVLSDAFGIPDLLADAELVGGGLHTTGARGRLDVHVDFNYIEKRQLHRRLNILVYFNEGWKPEWGGEIELWDSDVRHRVHAFEPIFNRCVVFETSEISFHGVPEVTCPPDVHRRSFAAYYYTKAAPAGWDGSTHTTVFKARPDEVGRRRMMQVQSLRDKAKGGVKRLVRGSSTAR